MSQCRGPVPSRLVVAHVRAVMPESQQHSRCVACHRIAWRVHGVLVCSGWLTPIAVQTGSQPPVAAVLVGGGLSCGVDGGDVGGTGGNPDALPSESPLEATPQLDSASLAALPIGTQAVCPLLTPMSSLLTECLLWSLWGLTLFVPNIPFPSPPTLYGSTHPPSLLVADIRLCTQYGGRYPLHEDVYPCC